MASAIKIIAGLFIILIGFPIFIGGSAVLLISPIFADNNGYFAFVVPYSTKEIPYETKPMGPYVLTFDNKSVKIDVTEKQIITGEESRLK